MDQCFKLIQDTFTSSGIQIQIVTRRETDSIRTSPSPNDEHSAEHEGEKYTNEWIRGKDELETDLTRDSKFCQPPCSEQFPVLTPRQLNEDLIDYYLQYQSQDIRNFTKQFVLQYTDPEDEELVTIIDMIIDCRSVYSQKKFDIGQIKQKFHVTFKPNSEPRKQQPSARQTKKSHWRTPRLLYYSRNGRRC